MGDWNHPPHFSETARRFAVRSRAAAIEVFMELGMPRLRETARVEGYALAVHGTLERDLDLIAVPWTERASSPDDLAKSLASAARQVTGWGNLKTGDWTQKPHGRVATTILACAEFHIDLSVTPRIEPPPAEG